METLLIVICIIVFLLAIVVFSPVVVTFDSCKRQVRVCWLFALEFQMPLPGTAGQKRLSVFNKPVSLRQQQPGEEVSSVKKKKTQKTAAGAAAPGRKRRAMGQFFMRCLGDSTIRRALARQVAKLIRRVSRSFNLARSGSDVSLPDPALNGMLAGALAALDGRRVRGIRVNFTGENSLFLELHFHLYRVFKAFLFLLPGLPYRAVFRQWRAYSAVRSH